MLLELFKYIIEEPEESQSLLEKMKATKNRQSKLIEGLVF